MAVMHFQQGVNNFDNPLSAAIYDTAEGRRDDLDTYLGIVEELKAHSVIDIGCGTGTLAVQLAARGLSVIGVDPAGAMLDVARTKAGGDAVLWIHGTAETLTQTVGDRTNGQADHSGQPRGYLPADMALMTGNVAQVFLTDEEWLATLRALHAALVPGGYLVFETRIPERRAWEEWAQWSSSVYHVEGVGEVRDKFQVLEVDLPFVTFSADNTMPDGSVVPNRSTLIFRSMPDLERTLGVSDFTIREVRDAPERPGREWVVVAQRS